MLGFNDTSTLVGHFVLSPRKREKRDRRDSRVDEREGQGRKRNRNESEENEEIKTLTLYPYLLQGQQALPNCKLLSVARPGDIRYMTPSHHPTTPLERKIKPFFAGERKTQQQVTRLYFIEIASFCGNLYEISIISGK